MRLARSGKLLVMASSPSYDPNLVENSFGLIGKITADCRPAAPLVNRASQGLYAPGSTFKVVTLAAALESNRYEPDSSFVDPGYCIAYGKRVNNFDTSRPFGNLTLATALQYSVNSVFCNIGKALGAKRILDQARKFGFYERPPLETPDGERLPSGLYRGGELWFPKRDSDVDAGRMAFGQERMLVTPLQMAMVAAGIGNAGHRDAPLGRREGRLAEGQDRRPHRARAARPRRRARQRARHRGHDGERGRRRHRDGGADLRLPDRRQDGHGRDRRRRAGTRPGSSRSPAGPAERPEVAIAVALEGQSSTGGATAAPIARTVMQALLDRTPNP